MSRRGVPASQVPGERPGVGNNTQGQSQSQGGQQNPSLNTVERDANMIKSSYTLGRTLGIGTFCKVQLGTHKATGLKCAVKIFNLAKLREMGVLNKIQTELDVMSLLTPHEHIVKLYQVVYGPLNIYAVLEFLPNGDLFDYIVSQGKLPENEARCMFQEIISGVDYCHANMVVHRDLKPENLLLDSRNHVKLADFGLSNVAGDGLFLKTSCGSPNYAAPEVISAELYPGPEVDVWSCGVILYAMLCGRLPFDSDNIHTLYKTIKAGAFNLPFNLPSGARDLISRLITVDPLRRLTIPQIRQHPWFAANLSPALSRSPWEQREEARSVDPESVAQVVKMGHTEVEIRTALNAKFSRRAAAGGRQQRQLTVPSSEEHSLSQLQGLYNLVQDNRRKRREDIERLKMGHKELGQKEGKEAREAREEEQNQGQPAQPKDSANPNDKDHHTASAGRPVEAYVPGEPMPWEAQEESAEAEASGGGAVSGTSLGTASGGTPSGGTASGGAANVPASSSRTSSRTASPLGVARGSGSGNGNGNGSARRGGLAVWAELPTVGTGLTFTASKAEDLMNALYSSLKKLNFEWKSLSLYRVKARHPTPAQLAQARPRTVLKLIITLYKAPRKVEEKRGEESGKLGSRPTSRPGSKPSSRKPSLQPALSGGGGANSAGAEYVLDFLYLCGRPFYFLDTCTNIASLLEAHLPEPTLQNSHLLPSSQPLSPRPSSPLASGSAARVGGSPCPPLSAAPGAGGAFQPVHPGSPHSPARAPPHDRPL